MLKPTGVLLLLSLASAIAWGQTEMCPPRPRFGSVIPDPPRLRSQNGVLSVDFTLLNTLGVDGYIHYCYQYGNGEEAPTLDLNPGDQLVMNITNHLTEAPGAMPEMPGMTGSSSAAAGPCGGRKMTSASTNVHFHGLNIPPTCHQDEVIQTTIQPNDPPFQYKIQIPKNDPPGLYWYHPHPHGFTTTQVLGGAAGALIVDGIEQARPETAGLPERVFVIRQFKLVPPGSQPQNTVLPLDADSSPVSINFVPAFVNTIAPTLEMPPGQQQLWRIVNATSIYFLALQVQVDLVAQNVKIVGLDGIPLAAVKQATTVVIPPAGRAEFIVQAPPAGSFAQLIDLGFDTGPGGDFNPYTTLANIRPPNSGAKALDRIPAASKRVQPTRFKDLAKATPSATRRLYFSERTQGANTQFFITVKGQKAKVYEPDDPPAIVTQQGAVEDWILENHSTEVHAFHMHQLHFIVLEINGKPTNDPTLRDTVLVPYWDGVSTTFPSIKVRVDFRDPETTGTFLYHCHILDHEDGGMMAKIQVNPSH